MRVSGGVSKKDCAMQKWVQLGQFVPILEGWLKDIAGASPDMHILEVIVRHLCLHDELQRGHAASRSAWHVVVIMDYIINGHLAARIRTVHALDKIISISHSAIPFC